MPSKGIIIVIKCMFLGVTIFWAFLRAHFNPRLTARVKMSLSRAQNIFMPKNIIFIALLQTRLLNWELYLFQLAELRAEKQDKEKWLEEERVQIVEAAKEFAVQQEQNFVKKIDNLKLKLASKNEEIQEMDSVINQQKHALKTAQQEKVSAAVGIR